MFGKLSRPGGQPCPAPTHPTERRGRRRVALAATALGALTSLFSPCAARATTVGYLYTDENDATNSVAAFNVDNGEAQDAPSPVDFIGPGEFKLGLEVLGAGAVKFGFPLVKAAGAKLAAAGSGFVGKAAGEGPVIFKAPLDATVEELSQLRGYVDGSNEALSLGKLSQTGRAPTTALERQASRAAAAERNRAAVSGTPYQGHVAHVPDTTWTNNPIPHKWMDMSPRLNSSLGAQSRRYPLGFKPTQFTIEGD